MRQLTQRERLLLWSAGPAAIGIAVWFGIVAPAIEHRSAALVRIADVDVLHGVLDRLPSESTARQPAVLPPVRQRITDSARDAGVTLSRIDPQGTAISLSLEDLPFTDLLLWLETLTGQHRLRLLNLEIGRRAEPGVVSARIVLEDTP